MNEQRFTDSGEQPAAGPMTIAQADQIRRIAEERLRNSPYAALRMVSCHYHDGVLILHGRLQTHYLKQVAQAIMRDLDGVLQITNRIEVVRRSRSPQSS